MRSDFMAQRLPGLRAMVAAASAVAMCACGGGSDPQAPATFVFRLHGQPVSEEFRAAVSSPQAIALARAQLQLPESQRTLFAIGGIAAGNGGVNLGWNWHFTEVSLTDSAIELCDGTPSMVEADPGYWLGTVKTFCPWSSYVHAEVR